MVIVISAPATLTEEIVAGIYAQVLGLERVGVDDSFFDLGGDSLLAMRVVAAINVGLDAGLEVRTVFEAPSVRGLSRRLGTTCRARGDPLCVRARPDTTSVHAADLTLDKFIDAPTLTAAPTLPGPSAEVRTVLLTGATGFLGRYLALEWLERMDLVDGTLICLVRAKSDEDGATASREDLRRWRPASCCGTSRELAADHLEVIAGDKSEANLGLDQQTWQRLADTVDLIVDSAAVVNSVLPYSAAVRAQRRGHRRADPSGAHHEAQALQHMSRLPTWATRSSRRRSPRMPTSGSSAPPARSTTAT